MLATDQFVFLHFPHAGGTFVYEIIKKFFPTAVEIGYHLPRALMPKEYATFPYLAPSATLGISTSPGITFKFLTRAIPHLKTHYFVALARTGVWILSRQFGTLLISVKTKKSLIF